MQTRLASDERRLGRTVLVVWAVCAVAVAGAVYELSTASNWQGFRLHDHGVSVSATVVKLSPAQHNGLVYQFTAADGQRYQVGGYADGREGDAAHLSVGQRITVVYDRRNPQTSCYCDPAIAYGQDRTVLILLVALLIVPIAAVPLAWVISRRRASAK